MEKLNFNQINLAMGKRLTPGQRIMGSKIKLYKPYTIHMKRKPDNNELCSCGSGIKYKKCCKS